MALCDTRSISRRGACAAGLLLLQAAALIHAASPLDHPDLSGVWTWNMRAGDNPTKPLNDAAANLPFTAEIKPRIDEYKNMARLSLENPG
ncbi:MAG TPA: hypothetical protein VMH83_11465, partial [Candidatus Acidoferrum sp.]|nr:hypothetical protein [Candidatus Acidoferrum sp.]